MSQDSGNSMNRISRRKVLNGLTVAAGASIAGCGGGNGDGGGGGTDGGDGGATGERVPTVSLWYFLANGATTRVAENMLPGIQDDLEQIGVDMEFTGKSVPDLLNADINDARDHNLSHYGYTLDVNRLDPTFFTHLIYYILNAGANGKANFNNYANCDHSMASLQSTQTFGEERQQYVTEAQKILAEDIAYIPLIRFDTRGAYRTDNVNIEALGQSGLQAASFQPWIESETKTGDPLRTAVRPSLLQSKNHLTAANPLATIMWTYVVYSPIAGYDENWDLQPILAKEIPEFNDDGTEVTIELREDATFHNGDPITADDVIFTFEFQNEFAGEYANVSNVDYTNIEAIDDVTVEMQFENPNPTLPTTTLPGPQGGILPKDHWESSGARDNPTGFTLDPVVGSGPFKVSNFVQGQVMELEPHDGHPVYEPSQGLILQGFQEFETGGFNSFQQGNLDLFPDISSGLADQVRNQMSNNAEVVQTQGFGSHGLLPHYSYAPTMFKEFRYALSYAIDRNNINQVAFYGNSKPITYGTGGMTETHPWFPGTDQLATVAEESANPEKAKQFLEEAGYSWDNQERLRYPSDKDLTPLWPDGSEPAEHPDKFPCVDELSG